MHSRSYKGIILGAAASIALSAVAYGIYAGFNAWPSIVGTWEPNVGQMELFTFTRDGQFVVTSASGDVPVGTYTQDGGYIKITTSSEMSLKGDGHLGFTLKVKFVDANTFTTDGPIGTYLFQRETLTFKRLSPEEVAQRKESAQSRSGNGQGGRRRSP